MVFKIKFPENLEKRDQILNFSMRSVCVRFENETNLVFLMLSRDWFGNFRDNFINLFDWFVKMNDIFLISTKVTRLGMI